MATFEVFGFGLCPGRISGMLKLVWKRGLAVDGEERNKKIEVDSFEHSGVSPLSWI
jgi:hypothetical protein